MKIESELDVATFVRNSKGISDAKVIQVLNNASVEFVEGIPSDRELLADRLELFYQEFPYEKPFFLDFNKPSQTEN